jgi:hypothetical protein
MTQISTKIKLYANRQIDFTKDVRLQDNSDGKGVFIAQWNLDINDCLAVKAKYPKE